MPVSPFRVPALVLACALSACAGAPPRETPPDPTPDPVADPTRAPEAGARDLKGTLRYTPLDAEKTVAAFLGVDLTVATDAGEVPLTASSSVSREALIALSGQVVALTCVPQPPIPVTPDESYPIDIDGQPMQRPSLCAVTAVRAAP